MLYGNVLAFKEAIETVIEQAKRHGVDVSVERQNGKDIILLKTHSEGTGIVVKK